MFFIIFSMFGLIATFFELAMYGGIFAMICVPLNKYWTRFCAERKVAKGWFVTVKVLFWILFVVVVIWRVPLTPMAIWERGEKLIGFPS